MTPEEQPKTPFSEKELEYSAELLLENRREIIGDHNHISKAALKRTSKDDESGEMSSLHTHLADMGSDTFEQEMELNLLESERQRVREIDEALLRIEEGTNGLCEVDDEPIAKARLEAEQATTLCVEHKRHREEGGA